jgi:lysophospholipase L1-like esterase
VTRRTARLGAALAAAILARAPVIRAQAPNPDPLRFEKDIAAFEAQDRAAPPPPRAALFVGSSSIRYWDVARAFPGLPTITRGYGGSHVSDTIHFADRIVVPYRPRLIVFYAGDADVAANKTADQIAGDYNSFVALVHQRLPGTPMAIIGIKPSPAHWSRMGTIRSANALVQQLVARDPLLAYADVERPLLGPDRQPRPDFYVANGLNLSERGYQAWNDAVKPVVEARWSKAER